MKPLLAIFALLISLTPWAQVTPPKKTFHYQKNAKLVYQDAGGGRLGDIAVGAGQNLVFYYEWQSAKNPQIADADRTDKLYFELTPAQAKQLEAKGDELKKYNTVRCRICFCINGGCMTEAQGELTVKQVGKKKFAVKYKDADSEKYLVDETFTLKKGKP